MEKRNNHIGLKSEPKRSWGSVILVDPFPSTQKDPRLVEEDLPIIKSILSRFDSARGEASFKEDEITAALNGTSTEKFMIAPKTSVDPAQLKQLATNSLGKFAGALVPKIPYHDFVLGRLNCQYFLQNVFVLKREDAMQNDIFKNHLDNIEGDVIPIIPLVGSAKEPTTNLEWHTFGKQEREAINRSNARFLKCVMFIMFITFLMIVM